MNRKTRALMALALILALALPFLVPSGALLDSRREQLMEEMWQEEDAGPDAGGLLDFLLPGASAEAPWALVTRAAPWQVPAAEARRRIRISRASPG